MVCKVSVSQGFQGCFLNRSTVNKPGYNPTRTAVA